MADQPEGINRKTNNTMNDKKSDGETAKTAPAAAPKVVAGQEVKVQAARSGLAVGDKVQHIDDPAVQGRVLAVQGGRVQVRGTANWLPAAKLRRV